ncbi:MAG: DUF2382 domain-containing protein [Cyanobacteria bacterium Co-bin8]|nr:DUF2382 domain-containing protein [Cyanobacteria bacterium Co-bin8]
MPEHQLIGSSVYDRAGYLLGQVVRVQPLSAGDFSLVVQLVGNGQAGTEITIGNNHLKDIDTEQKILHVNLDQQEIIPNAGKGIQLVEERLVVNRKRNKVGEISVRKVIETEIVEVPIRREKLVIEKIGAGEPLMEIGLGETRIQGAGLADGLVSVAGTGSATSTATATASQDLTTSADLASIREAITFLGSVVKLPAHHCEKVRVVIFLTRATGLEATAHQFESPETAIQVLSVLDTSLAQQCSTVRLELLLNDEAMVQTYQKWFAGYATR